MACRSPMASHDGESKSAAESVMEKITAKLHGHDSSSSDSENGKSSLVEAVESNIYRLFGREKPLHKVLGGGKPADVLLWRNKTISASILCATTAIWVLIEMLEYRLLTLQCYILMLYLASLFLWSIGFIFIKKSPPNIPLVRVPEKAAMETATALLFQINRGLTLLHNIAVGRDLKQFLAVTAGLWVLSAVGKWCDFITLFYILFVSLHTLPVIYEKYEDEVDSLADKVTTEIKKQYRVLSKKVLEGHPGGILKIRKLS